MKTTQGNKQCKLCDSWYAGEYEGEICPCCDEAVDKLKNKFNVFINNQKDFPKEFVDIINKNFWNLI